MSQAVSYRIVAQGLRFPEGPIAMSDGTVLVAEIAGGAIQRVFPDGRIELLVETGGGPNGMAIGPDGALYICNNGGLSYGMGHFTSIGPASNYRGGYIQRYDLTTGELTELYNECNGERLSSPNDIVFDSHGGFYFTDIGKRHLTHRDHGGVYYACIDGSEIQRVVYPHLSPNGIGLSKDGSLLYFADTETSRLYVYEIVEPGKVLTYPFPAPYGGRVLCGLPGFQRFDSLALDSDGNICVGTLSTGKITVISPAGEVIRQVSVSDTYPTNICFGGLDRLTAYVTLSESGQLAALPWPVPGLELSFNA